MTFRSHAGALVPLRVPMLMVFRGVRISSRPLQFLLAGGNHLQSDALNIAGSVDDVEDEGLDLAGFRLLVDVLNEVALALDASEGDLADLLGVECFPRLIVQVFIEGNNKWDQRS